MKKKILLGALVLFIAIQFVRPAKNISRETSPNDITLLHPTPPDVKAMLERACYDCHSDNTRYPWYTEVQPVGWWLARHVSEGRRHLNFSQFGAYEAKRAARRMSQTIDETNDHEMPLPSYLLIHREAKLSETEIDALENWAQTVRERVSKK